MLLRLFLSILVLQLAAAAPIDDYVHTDDGYFSYDEITSYRFEGATMYVVNMTSQKWLNESWSDTPIWVHPMSITIPDTIRDTSTALMFVLGTDYNDGDIPGIPAELCGYNLLTLQAARDSGTVVAYVANIPNQPIVFAEDPDQVGRREDGQIAFTWKQFLTEDPDKPNQLNFFAMTKAVVRAMTVVQEVVPEKDPVFNITKFGVLGASKRGATTWLAAAVDPRVDFIVPIVFPLLNAPVNLQRHFRSLNGWSYAFGPYYDQDLTPLLTGPIAELLAAQIDPYTFRDRLTMRKYVVAGTNDEFFFPDEASVWWDDMPEPKHLLMAPNTNHVMSPNIFYVYTAVISHYTAYLENFVYPTLTWTFEETETDGIITVTTDTPPTVIRGYAGTTVDSTNGRRDFRRRQGNPDEQIVLTHYYRTNVTDLGENSFSMTVPQPPEGKFTGLLIEAQWPGLDGRNIVATTGVYIIPTAFPFPECEGQECYGELL